MNVRGAYILTPETDVTSTWNDALLWIKKAQTVKRNVDA